MQLLIVAVQGAECIPPLGAGCVEAGRQLSRRLEESREHVLLQLVLASAVLLASCPIRRADVQACPGTAVTMADCSLPASTALAGCARAWRTFHAIVVLACMPLWCLLACFTCFGLGSGWLLSRQVHASIAAVRVLLQHLCIAVLGSHACSRDYASQSAGLVCLRGWPGVWRQCKTPQR